MTHSYSEFVRHALLAQADRRTGAFSSAQARAVHAAIAAGKAKITARWQAGYGALPLDFSEEIATIRDAYGAGGER